MGVKTETIYTCDGCGKIERKEISSKPNEWGVLQLDISPEKNKATVRKFERLLCDECVSRLLKFISILSEEGNNV